MSITRAKQSSLKTGVVKYDNLRAGLPFTPTIGTATDGGTGSTVSVAFTTNNTAGLTYTALSTPGSLTGTSTTSPITVSGLTSGTAYTFQVNAANSAGTSPYSAASNSVTPVTPTSFESIATFTGTGSNTSVTFSSIPGTYSSLQLRVLYKDTYTDPGFATYEMTFNGSTTGYARHRLTGDGSSATATGSSSNSSIDFFIGPTSSGGQANMYGAAIIDIHDYASTTKNKTVRALSGSDMNSGNTNSQIRLVSGLWANTSAITSITLSDTAYFFAAGSTFSLYGIK